MTVRWDETTTRELARLRDAMQAVAKGVIDAANAHEGFDNQRETLPAYRARMVEALHTALEPLRHEAMNVMLYARPIYEIPADEFGLPPHRL